VGDQSGTVRVIKLNSGATVATLRGHTVAPTLIAFQPGGEQLATTALDRTIRIWKVASGAQLHSFSGLSQPAIRLEWRPDGKQLAAAQDPMNESAFVKVWETAGGRLRREFPASDFAWSLDSARLATVSNAVVEIWNANSWSLEETLVGHTGMICDLAWSAKNDRLATAAADSTVRIWDTVSRAPKPEIPEALGACWHPDDNKLAVLTKSGETIQVIDLATRQPVATLSGEKSPIRCLAWNPAGTHLLSGSWGTRPNDPAKREPATNLWQLRIWDVAKRANTLTFGEHGFTAAAWSPDGTRIVAAANGRTFVEPNKISLFDAGAGQELDSWPSEGAGLNQVWFADEFFAHPGKSAAGGDSKAAVVLKEVLTGKERWRSESHPFAISAVALDPARKRLAAGGYETLSHVGRITIWDIQSGERVCELAMHDQQPRILAFHPTDNRLLSAGDNKLRLWDLGTGQELLVISTAGTHVRLHDAAWRPDGKVLMMLDSLGKTDLWDATPGYEHAAELPEGALRSFRIHRQYSGGGFF
jgi:WD40 repeat protein